MTTPSPENPGALNWALVMFLGIIWGAAFIGVRYALDGFGPFQVAAGRTGLGALALLVGSAALGQPVWRVRDPRAWRFIVFLGLVAVASPLLLLAWGQQHVPSAFAGVAMGAVPLMTLPLVYLFSPEEGIGPRRVIGIGLGFIGLIILVGEGAFDDTASPFLIWARAACLLATAGYAIGSVTTRRSPAMPPLAFAAGTMSVAACVLIPLALWREGLPQDFPAVPTFALLYTALFPTALAAFLRIRIITTAGSLFMNIVSYIVPVWAVIFGVVLRGEDLPPQLFLALAIILVGIGLSQSRAIAAAWKRRRG